MATFLGAWKYAYQHAGWQMVTTGKITSWFLMIVISIIIIIELKLIKQQQDGRSGTKEKSVNKNHLELIAHRRIQSSKRAFDIRIS